MINALHLKPFILQSSGEVKELKDCSNSGYVTPRTHREHILHLDTVLSDFLPEPLQLFLPERSTRCSGIILDNYKSDKLSSELVSPVERSPMCSRCQTSQIAGGRVPRAFQRPGTRDRTPSRWEVSLLPQGQLTFRWGTGGPSPVQCICRRVTQKVTVWKFGRVFLKGSRWMLNPTAPSRAYRWGNSSFLLLPGSTGSFFKARIIHQYTPSRNHHHTLSCLLPPPHDIPEQKKWTRTRPSQMSLSVHSS